MKIANNKGFVTVINRSEYFYQYGAELNGKNPLQTSWTYILQNLRGVPSSFITLELFFRCMPSSS